MIAHKEDSSTKILEGVVRGMPKCEPSRAFGASLSSANHYAAAFQAGELHTPKEHSG
jgi:hypothetical protein